MKLSDTLIKVIDNRGKTPPYSDDINGFELIETASLVGSNKYPDYGKIGKWVSKDTFDNWFRSGHPIKDDVLIATVGANIGSVAIMKETRGCVAQNLVGFRTNEEILSPHYLYYYLSWDITQQHLKNLDIGAAQPSIKVPHILELDIPLFPLPIQRKIADVLSAYDDLIEVNARRIRLLEAMAQSVYCEWFGKVDEMSLPRGWEMGAIKDISKIQRGKSYRSENLADEGLPFLNLKCFERDGGFRYDGIKRFQGEFKEEQTAQTGDIIMAVTDMTQERRVIARAARVPDIGEDFFVRSMDVVKLAPNPDVDKTYLYAMLRLSGFADEVKQHANGVNVLHLNPERIEGYQFALPPEKLRNEFGKIAEPNYRMCDVLEKQNANLRRTRDLLLPRLVSGETEVDGLGSRNLIENNLGE